MRLIVNTKRINLSRGYEYILFELHQKTQSNRQYLMSSRYKGGDKSRGNCTFLLKTSSIYSFIYDFLIFYMAFLSEFIYLS